MPSEIAARPDGARPEGLLLSQEQSAEIKKLEIQSGLEQARIIGEHIEAADRRRYEYAMDCNKNEREGGKRRYWLLVFYPLLAVAVLALVLWVLPAGQRGDAVQTLLTFGGGALTGFGGGAWWYNRPSRRRPG